MVKYGFEERLTEHDQIVRAVVDHFKGQSGCTIRADIDGYEQPSQIADHRPDVEVSVVKVVVDGANRRISIERLIFEVEVADSIDTDHTRSQCIEFADWASQRSTRTFVLVVPESEADAAQQMIDDLEIAGNAALWTSN